MQRPIERIVDVERFNMRALYDRVWQLVERHPRLAPHLPGIRQKLGNDYRKLGYAILRHVFLIELVKLPAIETTKVRVRWFPQLDGDQRWCSFEECLSICSDLIATIAEGWMDNLPGLQGSSGYLGRLPLES